jgi:hypothetical protein
MGYEHNEKVFRFYILIHLVWCVVSLWLHNKGVRGKALVTWGKWLSFFIFVCISRDLPPPPNKKNPRTLCWGRSSWFYMFLCSHKKRVVDVTGSSCTHGFSWGSGTPSSSHRLGGPPLGEPTGPRNLPSNVKGFQAVFFPSFLHVWSVAMNWPLWWWNIISNWNSLWRKYLTSIEIITHW